MLRNLSLTALTTSALIFAAPAIAQHGHSGSPPRAGPGAMPSGQGPMNASPNSALSTTTPPTTTTTTTGPTTSTTTGTSYNPNSPALQNGQGPSHASPTGISHANQNSVLARGAVSSSTLQGLNTGMTVNNSSGTSIGTVSRIITGPNNTIRGVVVTSSTGQTYTLAPSTLTISGGIVTTTSTTGG